jgi:glutamate/aspartate transport system substrate-binding protein
MKLGRLAAILWLLSTPVWAQADEHDGVDRALSGALKRIHDTGHVAIGYRDSAFPFSYTVAGKPVGYTIDLCLGIVAELERTLDRQLENVYVHLAAEARLDAVSSGKVDLECSSTTNNSERQKRVAFSPVIFIAGTKLMVRRDSPVRSYRDLAGKSVAVISGTTNEQVIRRINERSHLGARVETAPDYDQAFAVLTDGRADAFASDDVLLSGLIARKHAGGAFIVVGDFLSYEPYGIMYAKDDPALAEAVGRAFASMAHDRDLLELYHRWFLRPTITGERLDLPMSPQLAELFRVLGVED